MRYFFTSWQKRLVICASFTGLIFIVFESWLVNMPTKVNDMLSTILLFPGGMLSVVLSMLFTPQGVHGDSLPYWASDVISWAVYSLLLFLVFEGIREFFKNPRGHRAATEWPN